MENSLHILAEKVGANVLVVVFVSTFSNISTEMLSLINSSGIIYRKVQSTKSYLHMKYVDIDFNQAFAATTNFTTQTINSNYRFMDQRNIVKGLYFLITTIITNYNMTIDELNKLTNCQIFDKIFNK